MSESKKNIFKLTTVPTILIVYLLLTCSQYIYALIIAQENITFIAVRTLAVTSYFLLSYLTYKRNIIASWAMVFFLMLSGVSMFFFGIFAVPVTQYVFKLFCVLIGVYFSYGSVVLFKSIRKGEMKEIDQPIKA